jgi:hypothetical protein
MTVFSELHPVVQKHLDSVAKISPGDAFCGCTFTTSKTHGREVQMCRFHTGMSIGAEDALEYELGVDER